MEEIFEYKDCISSVQEVESINVYGVNKVSSLTPTFTIAIPTYKRTDTLVETIESALSQTSSNDYHIIVVDNNPERNDETELLMQRYIDHPKVSYYKNIENVGMAGNWNKCLLLSPSDKVILLHDDDVMSPFCIECFNIIISFLDDKWAMVKPNTIKFEKKEELKFNKPQLAKLYKLIPFHFFDSCPIGAPTIILLNKKSILNLGGYNSDFYPSFDYLMSARASLSHSLYLAWFSNPLGGYRIGKNASLSEKTMDAYYEKRYMIADSYCREKHIPKFVSKLIHSVRNENCVISDTAYYNMCDYVFKEELYDFWHFPSIIDNILSLLYKNFFRIPVFLNRKKIKID